MLEKLTGKALRIWGLQQKTLGHNMDVVYHSLYSTIQRQLTLI